MKGKILYDLDGDLFEFEAEYVHSTDLAVCVLDGMNKVWIPKSLLEDYEKYPGGRVRIVLQEWVAKDKGLI